MELKTVTYEEFLEFDPCWKYFANGKERLNRYAKKLNGEATALDVLRLTRVPIDDRLWAVLREDFISASILHEFACRCAERALSRAENPDPCSVAAIAAKRAWMLGEISDTELETAKDAVHTATYVAAHAATYNAAHAAYTAYAATYAATYAAARAAACAAADAAADAAACVAARAAEKQWQVDELTKMLTEDK